MNSTLLKRQRRIKRLSTLNHLTDVLLHPLLIPFYFIYILIAKYYDFLFMGSQKLFVSSVFALLVILPLIFKLVLFKTVGTDSSAHLYGQKEKKLYLLAIILPYIVALYLFNLTILGLFSKYLTMLLILTFALAILSFRYPHFDLHIIAMTCFTVVCFDICMDRFSLFILCCAIILTGTKSALMARLHRADTQTILFSILFGTGASILILFLQNIL